MDVAGGEQVERLRDGSGDENRWSAGRDCRVIAKVPLCTVVIQVLNPGGESDVA